MVLDVPIFKHIRAISKRKRSSNLQRAFDPNIIQLLMIKWVKRRAFKKSRSPEVN